MKVGYRLLVGLAAVHVGSVAIVYGQIASLPATFSVRTVDAITVPFQNGLPFPTFEKQRRSTIDLRGVWMKQRFAANHTVTLGLRDSAGYAALVTEAGGRQLPGFNDAGWTAKNLPSVENVLYGIDKRPEDYEDGVWYRRTFTVADSLGTKRARLSFLAVNYVADVWLNGRYLGYHEGGYTPFSFDVTSALRSDTVNVLAVRVDNPPWGSRNDIVPYGTLGHKPDWFNYTGIIHDVYLEFLPGRSIARVEVIPKSLSGDVEVSVVGLNKSGASGDVRVDMEIHEANVTSVNRASDYAEDLLGPTVLVQGGLPISLAPDSVRAVRSVLRIPSPRLWSPRNPNLYILKAVMIAGSDTVDQHCVQFGIRTLDITGNTLLLNGKPMFFPGVARHEDHMSYGRSLPRAQILTDLEMVVATNATFLRTGHYPNHPYTYLLADRLGLAILEEIPVWWFDETDAWIKQDVFRHIHEQMWREMLFRDRNRPSILFWSTSNECLEQTYRGAFIQRLNAELDAQYPDGRLVTQSAAADRPGPEDPTQAYCDVAGWTIYFGIFHGGTYYAGTRNFLQNAQTKYPAKPIVDTEFGYWSTEDLGTAAVQVTVFDSTFKAFSEFFTVDSTGRYQQGKPLCVVTWWCIFDWFSIQTGSQTMGLYKMDHVTAKPVAARLRSVYQPFKASSENAVLGIDAGAPALPDAFMLEQNYPNPFNGQTWISVQVPEAGEFRLAVYDLLGREVAVLLDGHRVPGRYSVAWDAGNAASGMYICRGVFRQSSQSVPMLLLR